jgi:transcription initiation factor IIE alpha subunit
MKYIDKILLEIFDEDEIKIIRYLLKKKEMNDFDLAMDLNMKPAYVRTKLNYLYANGFLDYYTYKKGKLIYAIWTVNESKLYRYAYEQICSKYEELTSILETCDVYYCPDCFKYYSSIESSDYGYLCPECNYAVELQYYDDTYEKYITKKIKNLERYISSLRRYIGLKRKRK